MSSPRRNDDSREDLRFDLKEIQLSKGGSGSTDAPPPSTLYDPAVLAISPDYRAKVQARKDRFTEGQDEPDSEDTPIHIPSPFPNPKRSVEIPVGQSKITMFDEDTDIGDEDPEMELCCHGYIPLYPTLVAINLFNILCGIIGMAVGAYQLSNSNGSIGLASMPRFVISGIYFFSLATTVTGLLFICTGSAGAVFFFSRWRTSPSGGKILDMVYHSLLFLVAILSMVLLGLTAYGTAMAAKGGMYDTEFWAELVRSNSGFLCDTEARLSCASFESRGQCVSLNNETVNTYCPGHFCIDFCRIAQDNVNIQPICESCRRDPLKSIPAFLDCRRHEKEVTRKQACQSFLPNDIQSAYQKILAAVILFILCVSISVSVSTYQYCLS